jgi:cytochrome P450
MVTQATATRLESDFMRMFQEPMADPRPFYEELRATLPVMRSPLGFWVVSTYELGSAVLTDDRAWTTDPAASASSGHNSFPDSFAQQIWYRSVMHADGERHKRLRKLVMPVFTAPAVARLREQVQAAVNDQLDRLPESAEIDLVHEFAEPLPTKVILDLLGLPLDRLDLFSQVSQAMLALWEPTVTAEIVQRGDDVWREAAEVILEGVAARRSKPGDDLLSHLVGASEDQERLSDDELVSMVLTIAVAGQETTSHMVCTGLYHLLTQDGLFDSLRQDLTRMSTAVEELLRYESPARCAVHRYAVEDTMVGDQLIRKGEGLAVLVQSADHDPAAFDDPLTIDLGRLPNRHLGLGRGTHSCLGAALARMELNISWRTLLERYPNISLVSTDVEWKPNLQVRGLEGLPVRLS